MTNFAVIGYGYWGPNIVRNLYSKKCKVEYVVDVDEERCKSVKESYPTIKTCTSYETVVSDPDIDAVIIVLPMKFHYDVAKKALMNGKHVLVEKPFASSLAQANELSEIARKNGLVLMIDHTYLYSSSIRKIKDMLKNRKIIHVESVRSNMGLFRKDANVIWDLAPHDLSIIEYITGIKPKNVSARGFSHTGDGIEDVAHMSFDYGFFTANITNSWISPEKIRSFQILTDQDVIIFNDLKKEDKIEVYDAGFKNEEGHTFCWNRGITKISTDEAEPLSEMLNDFITSIETGKSPTSDDLFGLDIIRALEAANDSIKNNGKQTDIEYE